MAEGRGALLLYMTCWLCPLDLLLQGDINYTPSWHKLYLFRQVCLDVTHYHRHRLGLKWRVVGLELPWLKHNTCECVKRWLIWPLVLSSYSSVKLISQSNAAREILACKTCLQSNDMSQIVVCKSCKETKIRGLLDLKCSCLSPTIMKREDVFFNSGKNHERRYVNMRTLKRCTVHGFALPQF